MIPILFAKDETKFNTFGIGALVDCISCEVEETADTWEFECTFTYPTNGRLYDKIRPKCIIYVDHDATKVPQPFDIYAYETSIEGITTFHAHHISYRLSKLIMIPQNFDNMYLPRLTDNIVKGYLHWFTTGDAYLRTDNFHFNRSVYGYVDDSVPSNIRKGFYTSVVYQSGSMFGWNYLVPEPMSAREALVGSENSLASLFHFDFKFDKWMVRVYTNTRGVDRPIAIRYDYNLTALQYEYDTSNTAPAIIPYWIDPQTHAPFYLDGDEDFFDESGANYDSATVAANGGGPDAPDPAGVNDFCLMGGTYGAITLDLSDQFDQKPTALQLLQAAYEYADNNYANKPHENLSIDFRSLQDLKEYDRYIDAQQLLLCDTCSVLFPEARLIKKMKTVRTVYDPLADDGAGRYTKLEFGSSSRGIYTVNLPKNTDQLDFDTTIIDPGDVEIEEDDFDPYTDSDVEIDPNEPEWTGPDEDAIIEETDP